MDHFVLEFFHYSVQNVEFYFIMWFFWQFSTIFYQEIQFSITKKSYFPIFRSFPIPSRELFSYTWTIEYLWYSLASRKWISTMVVASTQEKVTVEYKEQGEGGGGLTASLRRLIYIALCMTVTRSTQHTDSKLSVLRTPLDAILRFGDSSSRLFVYSTFQHWPTYRYAHCL